MLISSLDHPGFARSHNPRGAAAARGAPPASARRQAARHLHCDHSKLPFAAAIACLTLSFKPPILKLAPADEHALILPPFRGLKYSTVTKASRLGRILHTFVDGLNRRYAFSAYNDTQDQVLGPLDVGRSSGLSLVE
jgi:hypothetical protein